MQSQPLQITSLPLLEPSDQSLGTPQIDSKFLTPTIPHKSEKDLPTIAQSPQPELSSSPSSSSTSTKHRRPSILDPLNDDKEAERRRRNSLASARSRAKKKMKETVMTRTVREYEALIADMRDSSNNLKREIKLLRSLLLSSELVSAPPKPSPITSLIAGQNPSRPSQSAQQNPASSVDNEEMLNLVAERQVGKRWTEASLQTCYDAAAVKRV